MADSSISPALPDEKGVYVLCMYLSEGGVIAFGKREEYFSRGYYFYTGSAHGGGGLRGRLQRHASETKKIHWHIDYLLARVKLKQIMCCVAPQPFEHELAGNMPAITGLTAAIQRFGSTDCNCETHLFYSPNAKANIAPAFSGREFTIHRIC